MMTKKIRIKQLLGDIGETITRPLIKPDQTNEYYQAQQTLWNKLPLTLTILSTLIIVIILILKW